jgi:branched-chain amino acid transport system ATP-binding protein
LERLTRWFSFPSALAAEQNFHQATKIADRGYVIVQGQIAFEGHTPQELSAHELVKQYYLGV